MKVRGIRGAITVDADDPQAIVSATKRLLSAIIEHNEVDLDDIASVLFSLTPDLRAVFPALGAREMGWVHVPMLHFSEIDVPGALPRVIRVLMHVNTALSQTQVEHVYLDGARVLRPDLALRQAQGDNGGPLDCARGRSIPHDDTMVPHDDTVV